MVRAAVSGSRERKKAQRKSGVGDDVGRRGVRGMIWSDKLDEVAIEYLTNNLSSFFVSCTSNTTTAYTLPRTKSQNTICRPSRTISDDLSALTRD
jgi:hypothetical protein